MFTCSRRSLLLVSLCLCIIICCPHFDWLSRFDHYLKWKENRDQIDYSHRCNLLDSLICASAFCIIINTILYSVFSHSCYIREWEDLSCRERERSATRWYKSAGCDKQIYKLDRLELFTPLAPTAFTIIYSHLRSYNLKSGRKQSRGWVSRVIINTAVIVGR